MARHRLSYPLRILFPQPPARARTAAALAVLALFTLFTYDHALTAVGNFLVVEDLPSEAEAIVVLSGDLGARLEQGVELYRQGYAPRLILAGGGQPGRPSAAEVMKRQAVALGVPSAAALLVNESTSTREDALFTRELMAANGIRSAILVTSPYHQRRAVLTFRHVFAGSGISVASYPVRDDQWQADSWWRSQDNLRLTLVELAKLAYYKLSGYL